MPIDDGDRLTHAAKPTVGAAAVIARVVDSVMLKLARHWLAVINLGVAVFAGLPLLAPYLFATGYNRAAHLIFLLYRAVCHQMASRSFFVWGYQMAYCQRNTAIYASILVGGLVFALARQRLRRLGLRPYLLLIAPMALDGFTQITGLRESTWQLRVVTGALFGFATVWLIYPILEQAFKELSRSAQGQRQQRSVLAAS